MPYPPSSGSMPRPLLLIVDDDPAVLDVTRSMARAIGCRAIVADTAEQALELFAAESPRLTATLVDLHMPGVNGLELLARMREHCAGAHLVLMTGDELDADEQAVADRVTNAVLTKPYHLDRLRKAVYGAAGEARAA